MNVEEKRVGPVRPKPPGTGSSRITRRQLLACPQRVRGPGQQPAQRIPLAAANNSPHALPLTAATYTTLRTGIRMARSVSDVNLNDVNAQSRSTIMTSA